MKRILLIAIIGLGCIVSSCKLKVLRGEGPKGSITPETATFTGVDIDLPMDATITVQEGTQTTIRFNGYENILKHLKTKVENNTLVITSDLDDTWRIDLEGIDVIITTPSLNSLSLSGASDADLHGNIAGKEFKLEMSGACKVTIDNINVDDFSTEASGASSIEVKGGVVKHASYEISGAGKLKAFALQTNETSASISGAGKGEVNVTDKLTADISGAGTIHYKGHPTVTKDISGAGSVSEAN